MNFLERTSILLVNDREDQLLTLESILTPLGQELVKASSGREALRLLLNKDFAVVLLDVKMPGMDGFETATLIRQRKKNEIIPIIFVTAAPYSPKDLFTGYSLGAVDYIFSPVEPEILRAKVRSLTDLYQKTLQVRSQAERLGEINNNLVQEIAKRKQIECVLQQKNVELENAQLEKDRFLANMSHELRTPLNAIIGFTGTLLMKLPGPLTENQEKQLKTVQISAKHLLAIINELLDLARISTGQVMVTLRKIICCDAVEEIITTLQPFARKKGLEFFSKPFPTDWWIKADQHILRQILINLTNNAIKFTEQGSVWLEVARQQVKDQSLLTISVHDTGIGIKKEEQSRLFQPFEPLHNLPHLESTGLGLHLSQKLATLINGHLEYQSEYGKGSQFTLVLPYSEEELCAS